MFFPTRASDQRGFSAVELLAVVAVIAAAAVIALPKMRDFYLNAQLDASTAMVRSMVQRARIAALKEKVSYRLVIHDESASLANHVELQRDEGGTFVVLDGEIHSFPSTVRVLGSGSTNSMDSVTVTSRGACNTGSVYIAAEGGSSTKVDVEPSCMASAD